MPSREDETTTNINHPSTCLCPECIKKRKRIKYPYPAEIECPSCGNISMYFSEKYSVYKCVHQACLAEGKTIQEIMDKKTNRDKMLENLFNQFNR